MKVSITVVKAFICVCFFVIVNGAQNGRSNKCYKVELKATELQVYNYNYNDVAEFASRRETREGEMKFHVFDETGNVVVASNANMSQVCMDHDGDNECHYLFIHGNGLFNITDYEAEEVLKEGKVYHDNPELLPIGHCHNFCGYEEQQLTFVGLTEDEPMLYDQDNDVVDSLFRKLHADVDADDGDNKKQDDKEVIMKTTCLKPSECYKLIGSSHYVLSNSNINDKGIEKEIGSTFHGAKTFGNESNCRSHCDTKPLLGITRRGLELLQMAASVSGSDPLIDVHSPQYSAACWIIYDDPQKLHADDSNALQRYILALMFYTLGGNEWKRGFDFMTSKHECHWNKRVYSVAFNKYLRVGDGDGDGVHCNRLGYVTGLILPSNNLFGTIPFELASLTEIQYIDFLDNLLHGSMPSTLGNLQHLHYIRLQANALTGSIPESLGDMGALNFMNLGDNSFTGTVPSLLAPRDFFLFDVRENMFSGTIPEDIVKWSSLSRLYMEGNQLSGTIPEGINNLKWLEIVYLYNNNLVGTIPSKILQLPRLEVLLLFDNFLTGSIPSHVAINSPLFAVYLENNQLTGEIPTALSLFEKLQYVWLDNNRLSGEIPSNFTNLQNLVTLTVQNNNITGNSPFHDCQESPEYMEADCDTPEKVTCPCCTACHGIFTNHDDELVCTSGELIVVFETLEVGDWVQFEILNFAGKLIDLVSFSADNTTHRHTTCVATSGCFTIRVVNYMHKKIVMKLFINKNILLHESLIQKENNFYFGFSSNGTIQNGTCDSFDLCDAAFERNSTKRELLDKLVRITGAQVFDDISSSYHNAACDWVNYLEGVDNEDEYKYSKLLQYFFLTLFYYETNGNEWTTSDLWVTNTTFCSWYGIQCDGYGMVTSVRLPSNNLKGSLPTEIGELRGLHHLVLGNNSLFGEIPVEIGVKMTKLKEFNVTGNRLLGSIPSQFTLLRELRSIDASYNELSGSIPEEIGMMESVELFNFFDNTLSGQLPESFYGLRHLRVVNLGSNLLVGDASGIKNLLGLEILDLSRNYFTGTVPLGSYQKNLRVLQLSGNRFRGSIPSNIEQLSSLEELLIYNNELTGNLPSQVGNLEKLVRVSLSYNNIKGFIPSDVGNLKKLTLFHLHNNQMEGNADHFNYSIGDFITDCGNTFTASARVQCKSCSSCCNVDGDCLGKNITWPAPGNVIEESQLEARAFVFLMTLASSFALVAVLFIVSLLCETNEIAFSAEFQDESTYKFLLSRNVWAKLFALGSVLLQLFLLSIFIEASDFTSARNDWEYSMSCPSNSIYCEDKRGITPLAWLAFSCILVAHLMKDMLEASKMIYESIILKSMKGVFAGFVVSYVTIASVVASILYNYSTGISSTDILKDAAILLFLNDIDEQLYALVRIARPQWVEERNESVLKWLDKMISKSNKAGNSDSRANEDGDVEKNSGMESRGRASVTKCEESSSTNDNDYLQNLEEVMCSLRMEIEEHKDYTSELRDNFAALEADHRTLQRNHIDVINKHAALEGELSNVKKALSVLERSVQEQITISRQNQ